MWTKLKAAELKFWNWMRQSGTIAWARFQMLAGAMWIGLSQTDLSNVLDPKLLTYWLIINGIVSEIIRRKGTEVQTSVQYVPGIEGPQEVVKLVDTNAGPPTETKG